MFYVQEDIVNSIDILVTKVSELNCLLFLKPSVDLSSGENCRLIHLANGVGAFMDNMDEILLWLKKMRSVNVDERYKYKFGNME